MQTANTTGGYRLPIPLLSGDPASRIQFTNIKPAGTKIASVDGYLVGTIYRGNCTSQRNQQTFYDVAFPRVTRTANQKHTTGIMLDSETFDTEKDALDFLTSLVLASGGSL